METQPQLNLLLPALILSIFFILIARRVHFFIPLRKTRVKTGVNVWHVVASFAIYLIIAIPIPLIIRHILVLTAANVPWIQLGIMLSTIFFLALFALTLPRGTLHQVLKESQHPLWKDAAWGLGTYFLAYPVVFLFEKILTFIVTYALGPLEKEQIAVQYVKESLGHPLSFIIALFTVIIAAPIIEEYLFRGLFQTWLRKFFGAKGAILLSSFFFAAFHLAPQQGISNIVLFGSLFLFAYFLGFLYERQRSLIAPMMLHALFNTISILQILYFPNW